jgi:crotonobetainyl-CoA:carnitine CoA-transferase CaiB-like acyl-CoA transferase
MAALYHRDHHDGPGQVIDISLYEAAFSLLGPLPTLYHHNGVVPARNGSRVEFSSPRNVYPTADGHHFVVTGVAPSAASRLLRLVGGEAAAADARFSTPQARAMYADEVDELVAAWIVRHNVDEVERAFQDADASGVRVFTLPDIAEDPHYAARETLVGAPDEELGEVVMHGPVPRMSVTPGRIAFAGRQRGSDNDEILGRIRKDAGGGQ